jgi:hypothetical protein
VEVQSATNPVHDEEDDDGDSASLGSTNALVEWGQVFLQVAGCNEACTR